MGIQFNKLIHDWESVLQNTIVKSDEFRLETKRDGIIQIKAALNSITAHTGTRFIIQTSANSFGDGDWYNLVEFIGLIGTAETDLSENTLVEGATSITLTGHSLTTIGEWLFIADSTIENSEIVMESAQTTNAITLLDGIKNDHVIGTPIFNIVMEQTIKLSQATNRVRVIVDNSYDSNGSGLDYKVNISTTMGV